MFDYSTLVKKKNKKFQCKKFLMDNPDHMEELSEIMTKARYPSSKDKTGYLIESKVRVDNDQLGISYYILEYTSYDNHKESPFAASPQFNESKR